MLPFGRIDADGTALHFRLSDGRPVLLRGLTARDSDLHREHLLRLSPEDRRLRFHGHAREALVEDYARRLDWRRLYMFGAFVEGELRGVGELIPLGTPGEAELAVSVEGPFQHLGLGKVLVLAVILAGRRIGLRHIHVDYLQENDAMRALARDASAETVLTAGVSQGIITLRPPATDAGAA